MTVGILPTTGSIGTCGAAQGEGFNEPCQHEEVQPSTNSDVFNAHYSRGGRLLEVERAR